MKIKTFPYMIKQGLTGIWRNRGMSLASITTVSATLMILGLIITLVLNINGIAYMLQSQFDTVQLYLEEDIAHEEITDIGKEIGAIDGVSYVEFETKEEALDNLKEQWGDQGYLLDTLEDNPLPDSYIVHVENIETADSVVDELRKLDGIDEIKYYQDIIDNLLRIAGFVRTIGFALIMILILIAMFIISNTIKITLNARRQEITIMKYVGATNWFIRWPFVIEGMLLGFIGALIASGVVYFAYQSVFDIITTRLYVLFSGYMVTTQDMMTNVTIIFLIIGCGVGILGSIISLRKHLKV
ncbi:permease-like cell division protein FtsX [Serpentinicella sp. ANB-PHB4]|uniref:permease-like cell division protein FtsX n=1 Tax=Serpentinicella sp. ANB-PHB4 TaxID=3074076 RepID=UPI00285AA343|nr:permease-like cell division protein FtsX [Serpentinicella sp. ANB-PHB4]MDR5659363.1 permease-like cell division protein FtsX [Serpentinicella sp. ANB-PHB4]